MLSVLSFPCLLIVVMMTVFVDVATTGHLMHDTLLQKLVICE